MLDLAQFTGLVDEATMAAEAIAAAIQQVGIPGQRRLERRQCIELRALDIAQFSQLLC